MIGFWLRYVKTVLSCYNFEDRGKMDAAGMIEKHMENDSEKMNLEGNEGCKD